MNSRTVLSNAGPLIVLAKLNRLELLAALYGQVQIPQVVYTEVVTQGLTRGASDALTVRLFWQQQNWPVIETPAGVLEAYQPPVTLHSGEPVKGTLGVLVQAYRLSHLLDHS